MNDRARVMGQSIHRALSIIKCTLYIHNTATMTVNNNNGSTNQLLNRTIYHAVFQPFEYTGQLYGTYSRHSGYSKTANEYTP